MNGPRLLTAASAIPQPMAAAGAKPAVVWMAFPTVLVGAISAACWAVAAHAAGLI